MLLARNPYNCLQVGPAWNEPFNKRKASQWANKQRNKKNWSKHVKNRQQIRTFAVWNHGPCCPTARSGGFARFFSILVNRLSIMSKVCETNRQATHHRSQSVALQPQNQALVLPQLANQAVLRTRRKYVDHAQSVGGCHSHHQQKRYLHLPKRTQP